MTRNISMYILAIILATCPFDGVLAQGLDLYVSLHGNDTNPGTMQRPLKTLQGARDRLRALRKTTDYTDTLHVHIESGWYGLHATLELGPEDSGTDEAPVVYEVAHGKKAIFSGGFAITGFVKTADGLWQTKIPEVPYWGWSFDQLYVNGHRATRAKSPNKGYFHLQKVRQEVWVQGTGRHPERASQIVGIGPHAAREMASITDAEFPGVLMTVFHHWNITKRHLDNYNADSATIITSGEGMKPWNPWNRGKRFILENYKAALDTAGEWYLAPDGILFYHPFQGEDIKDAKVVAPALRQLVRFNGHADTEQFVRNIIFKNISFEHAAYNLPPTGFEPYQAAISVDAAIELNGSQQVRFINCEIAHTGGYALWLNQGVTRCSILHCHLHDLGAGGIRIGELSIRKNIALQTGGNTVDNSIIQHGGFEFAPGVGILIGQSADNRITHNDIADFRYTGVSVGWVWGYAFSPAKNNKILHNHIHHIGWGVLSDMAGVYTLGSSAGTEVSHNHIHHIYAYDYGGWGLYTDEGSSNIRMENNLVHHTKTGGFHQHYGQENTIRNNIFAFSKMYQIQATRVEDHLSFHFEHNIILYDRGELFHGPFDRLQAEIDRNIYWNMDGQVIFPTKDLKTWKKLDHDRHSVVADPGFRNPHTGDFSFTSRKAIHKIKFVPFEYTQCGVYGDKLWTRKAQLDSTLIHKFNSLFN